MQFKSPFGNNPYVPCFYDFGQKRKVSLAKCFFLRKTFCALCTTKNKCVSLVNRGDGRAKFYDLMSKIHEKNSFFWGGGGEEIFEFVQRSCLAF